MADLKLRTTVVGRDRAPDRRAWHRSAVRAVGTQPAVADLDRERDALPDVFGSAETKDQRTLRGVVCPQDFVAFMHDGVAGASDKAPVDQQRPIGKRRLGGVRTDAVDEEVLEFGKPAPLP